MRVVLARDPVALEGLVNFFEEFLHIGPRSRVHRLSQSETWPRPARARAPSPDIERPVTPSTTSTVAATSRGGNTEEKGFIRSSCVSVPSGERAKQGQADLPFYVSKTTTTHLCAEWMARRPASRFDPVSSETFARLRTSLGHLLACGSRDRHRPGTSCDGGEARLRGGVRVFPGQLTRNGDMRASLRGSGGAAACSSFAAPSRPRLRFRENPG